MSAGDVRSPNINYDSDDSSSSSKPLFIRPSAPIVSSVSKVMTDKHSLQSNSRVRCLEDKLNTLQQFILDLSNQVHQLKSVVNSPTHSPVSHSRPNSTQNYIHNHEIHQHRNICSSTSPTHLLHPHENYISLPAKTNSLHHNNILAGADQTRYLQEALYETKSALERRETKIKHLQKQNNELLHFQSIFGNTSPNIQVQSTHKTTLTSQNSQKSAFIPIVNSFKHRPVTVPTNISTSAPIMPFTMSLTNTLPNFSGKANEMPSKFITEFELYGCYISSARFSIHQQRTGVHTVELLVHSRVAAEFHGESFGNKI
jgi:hypothetical protein